MLPYLSLERVSGIQRTTQVTGDCRELIHVATDRQGTHLPVVRAVRTYQAMQAASEGYCNAVRTDGLVSLRARRCDGFAVFASTRRMATRPVQEETFG